MLDLELPQTQVPDLVLVQEEPALEIALPQTFTQPGLTSLQLGKIADVEALLAKIISNYKTNVIAGLGTDYQALVSEFAPLFAWAMASWDYLLSTQGCRFVPRNLEHKIAIRGDYRAFSDKDFSRLVHRIFRQCVLDFAQQPQARSLSEWLRQHFWTMTLVAYEKLEEPPDPHQRTLSAYSYLRCIPYKFLNDYHHELVYSATEELPPNQRQAIETYFFRFFTESATADAMSIAKETSTELLRQGLTSLLIHDRLVYCLLRQIERY